MNSTEIDLTGINYCTFFIPGNWNGCCWTHDEGCLLAQEYESYQMRLDADVQLRKCVTEKGNPFIAWFMFIMCRIWAETVWRFVYGIK